MNKDINDEREPKEDRYAENYGKRTAIILSWAQMLWHCRQKGLGARSMHELRDPSLFLLYNRMPQKLFLKNSICRRWRSKCKL